MLMAYPVTSEKLKYFLIKNYIDIMLVSETHFTNKTYLQIKNYDKSLLIIQLTELMLAVLS